MNFNDSAWLERSFLQRGFVLTSIDKAKIIVVNTCSVREKPEQKVYNILRQIRSESKNTENAFVVVAGCVAQQIGAGFFEKFTQVRLVCGSDNLKDIPESVEKLLHEPHLRISLLDFSESYPERDPALEGLDAKQALPVAYVNIMQGCDNYCAYCIVPYTRGKQKSRSKNAIIQECRSLVEKGTKEICLLGQNVNAFGKDMSNSEDAKEKTSFANLLQDISKIDGLKRLRFMTPHPKDITDEDIEAFGKLDNLCPHVHLPMQAGSDTILKAMGRKYTAQRFLEIVKNLRLACPQISFSSDIIVGFPGESEEDFLQTCDMLERVDFRASFSFCYSDRPGTRASKMPLKVAHDVMFDRLQRLQAKQEELTFAWLQKRQDTYTTVLLESKSKKDAQKDTEVSWQGRDPHGVTVNVSLSKDYGKSGLLIPVKIITAKKHTLIGQNEEEMC